MCALRAAIRYRVSIDNVTKLALALGFQVWEFLSPEAKMSSESHERRSS